MKDYSLTYHHYSERSILVQWPQEIDEFILEDILNFKKYLINLGIKSILQINIAYNSILINYVSTIDNIYSEKLMLKEHYFNRCNEKNEVSNLWRIPVCYDDKFGIDLDEISKEKGLLKSDIIRLHCASIYTVFFIGFLPGFLYLGGLDYRLHFPRKKQPRFQIKKGSVAIGDQQTGIYPNVSPAGWNVIGNSPIEFFDVSKNNPCFAKPGDKIKFVPVSLEQHEYISKVVQKNEYQLNRSAIDG